MANRQGSAALQSLRTLFSVGAVGGLTDGELLGLFVTRGGEAAELAFAALVERHGPMVLRVCRRITGDPHDAEDALQATFLILAQRSRSIRKRDSAASWLHGVARRVAVNARMAAARRRAHEQKAAGMVRQTREDPPWDDQAAVVHEEIERLPERHRGPIVLCELEGLTESQAAARLGVPVGTVRSRLARGRERLRKRLLRRGLGPDQGAFVATLGAGRPETRITPALVDQTTRAAIRSLTARGVLRGTAATLAEGVLRTMLLTRCLKVASVVIGIGAAGSGALLLAQGPGNDDPAKAAQTSPAVGAAEKPDFEARTGKLTFTVSERGWLESSSSLDGVNEVRGTTTILSLLPEGTRVNKGDLVAELDSANLRDQLTIQVIATQRAAADLEQAHKTREVAEIAKKEYLEGTFPRKQQDLERQIKIAQQELIVAQMEQEAAEQEPKNNLGVARARLRLSKAEFRLQNAQTRLKVLEMFTKAKQVKELEANIEKARSDELAKEATYNLEKDKEAFLRKQIEKCRLYAPTDGMIVYANDPSRSGRNPPLIEEGVTVRERQRIFSIPDLSQMRVSTRVPESIVDRVQNGMKARITGDAFADQVFEGTVRNVSPLPDPTSFSRAGVKVYTTLVQIDDFHPGLRPGMTAQVEIQVAERDNVLSVPVQAVFRSGGKDHVAVKKPDGGFEWREVTLGLSNGKLVEVKEGLRDGERVSLDPRSLLREDEPREKLDSPSGRTSQAK